ncbi:IST1-like protein [Camellia sinensis]|uniref:IST1-like protein n=1 Tax=Camellia sinensis var. sinensis TaxID=542762 RepID=A0A4S4DQL7_CAMSN|nr:IST1-like protein [Camellia sinensis]THG05388.1 hypothetical protein TEA_002640 [Camellia sinensis var. sinensis]
MTAVSVATRHCKKAMKLGISLFRRGFNSSKCKTMTKMAVARIKLLRNKREAVVKQMRHDIAVLLRSGQDATARIRVEHVIREQNIMAANEFLELFCELVVSRLPIIAKQRECPLDLKEGISSLLFAAPRCSDIPELLAIRDIFEKKYGKDFVSAAVDLRPNAGVNRMLIEKLSVRTPSGQVKLKVMKEIAKEHQIEWDTTESEMELLKPPEELIEGPRTFVSASSLPVKPIPRQSTEPNKPISRYSGNTERDAMHFQDTASAAEAAAESAKKAMAAAEAAAYLAKQDPSQVSEAFGYSNNFNGNPINYQDMDDKSEVPAQTYKSHSVGRSHYSSNEDIMPTNMDVKNVNRRHSYNVPPARCDIKFDESDCDEEIDMEEPTDGNHIPPNRPASQVPRIHPKLPDYDALAARFEALKYRKSQT